MKLKLTILLMVLSFVLSGCNTGPTPEEEIYETLEEVVNLETSFKEQQNPLVELEKKEKELYDQIISLGMKEFDKIVALSEEALAIVEERETRLNEENASIEASKEKFNLVKDYIANLEDEKLSEDANQLIELMENRYSSYSTLYSNYLEAIGHDKNFIRCSKVKT